MDELRDPLAPRQPIGAPPLSVAVDRGKVAPWWHTILFVVLMGAYGFLELHHPLPRPDHAPERVRVAMYSLSIVFEFALLGYVWLLGLRLEGKKLRDIIGGNWSKFDSLALDFGTALLFWMAVMVVLVALHFLLHIDQSGLSRVKSMFPQTPLDFVLWIGLSCSAGFCEETVFRGYLQRQLQAAIGNKWAAALLQALLFGWVHIYQGAKNAVVITVYGAMFGLLAVIRGSLRPGMIQHAGQDTLSGIAGAILSKHKFI